MALLSKWLVVPTLVLLVGLASVFSTPNDKNKILVATPGPVRVAIELVLYSVAAVAPWFVWMPTLAAIASLVVLIALITGFPRLVWLLKGAKL